MRVIVFFGEMGSGKSFCAKRLANDCGLPFFEGDSVVTRELLDRSGRFRPIPRHVIREFVQVLARAVIQTCSDLGRNTGPLVVAQALYLRDDRAAFAQLLAQAGHTVRWVWVRAPFWTHVRNLLTRKETWRWVGYMLVNKPFFQAPAPGEATVYWNSATGDHPGLRLEP